MNIWILQHYATPPDTLSGTRHFNFAKQLLKRGHTVSIWAAGFNHSTFKEERLSGLELVRTDNIEGVDFVWIRTPSYTKNDWRRMANIITYSILVFVFGMLKRKKPDVIWGSNPHLFAGLVGYLLSKMTGARFVFEVRDLWPQVFVDLGAFRNDSRAIAYLRRLEGFIYNKAEMIITLMPKAFNYITSVGIPEHKIVYIPHAVDFEAFLIDQVILPDDLAVTLGHLRSKGKTIIGYIGAHGIADGLETLVDAAEIVQKSGEDHIHFVLVGSGTEREKIVQRARDKNLSNIDLFNFIPKTAVPEFIRSFDIGIICKRKSEVHKYGVSFIKIFDYMACAKPIIWAVYSDDDPIQRTRSGLSIEADNPEKMAQAIQKMAAMSAEEQKQYGDNGYNYVFKNHHYDKLTDKIESVLIGDLASSKKRVMSPYH